MRSSRERINIAASAQKLDVDNSISLRYYYGIADYILKQRLLNSLSELEDLKPGVKQKINELNRRYQSNSSQQSTEKNQNMTYYGVKKAVRPAARDLGYYGSRTQQVSYSKPMKEQFRRIFQQPVENQLPGKNDHSNSEPKASSVESTLTVDNYVMSCG